jgi:hypothetical protein
LHLCRGGLDYDVGGFDLFSLEQKKLLYLASVHPRSLKKSMGTWVSVRFRNEHFFLWARPHKGFDRRHSMATLRIKTRGERRPEEKGPFMDGHQLKSRIELMGDGGCELQSMPRRKFGKNPQKTEDGS